MLDGAYVSALFSNELSQNSISSTKVCHSYSHLRTSHTHPPQWLVKFSYRKAASSIAAPCILIPVVVLQSTVSLNTPIRL